MRSQPAAADGLGDGVDVVIVVEVVLVLVVVGVVVVDVVVVVRVVVLVVPIRVVVDVFVVVGVTVVPIDVIFAVVLGVVVDCGLGVVKAAVFTVEDDFTVETAIDDTTCVLAVASNLFVVLTAALLEEVGLVVVRVDELLKRGIGVELQDEHSWLPPLHVGTLSQYLQ